MAYAANSEQALYQYAYGGLWLTGAEFTSMWLASGVPVVWRVPNRALIKNGWWSETIEQEVVLSGVFPWIDALECGHSSPDSSSFWVDLGPGGQWEGPLRYHYEEYNGTPVARAPADATWPGLDGTGALRLTKTCGRWGYADETFWERPGWWRQTLSWGREHSYNTTQDTSKSRSWTCNLSASVTIQHGVNVLQLFPDTVLAGEERVTLRIRGAFPKEPNQLAIEITPSQNSNGGPAHPVPVVLADPAPRVIEEDIFLASVWRTLEFDVRIPEEALGFYDVIVTCGEVVEYRMDRALNVLKIECMVPDAFGNPVAADIIPACDPAPTIRFPSLPTASSVRILAGGNAQITVNGVVRDAFAELVKFNLADIDKVDVFANGVLVDTIRGADLLRIPETTGKFRPYAHRCEFTKTITFPLDQEGASLRFVTENSLGNAGSSTILMSAHRNGVTQGGGTCYNLKPTQSGDPAQSARLIFWIGDRSEVAGDPRLDRQADGKFTGTYQDMPVEVEITQSTVPDPLAFDALIATIRLGPTQAWTLTGTFTETGTTNSELYRLFIAGFTASEQLEVVDVAQGAETGPGSFQPFFIQISGDPQALDAMLEGKKVAIGDTEYDVTKQAGGVYTVSGSETRVFIVSKKKQIAPNQPPKELGKYIYPFTNAAIALPGGSVTKTQTVMNVTDVLKGDKDVDIVVSVNAAGTGFSFKVPPDSFRIIPWQGGAPLSPAGAITATTQAGVTTLKGRFALVDLELGMHGVEITTAGETHIIPNAIEILQPVRLIVANMYGDDGDTTNPDPLLRQGFDDHVSGSAKALGDDKNPRSMYRGDSTQKIVITVRKPGPQTSALCGDISSLAELVAHLTRPKNEGGAYGIRLGTVISVDTLGHGVQATGNTESALKLAAVDPDNPRRTVLVWTAAEVNVRDQRISYDAFVGYFDGLLAKIRTVDFNLWHCFAGSALPDQASAAKRIAEAFAALGATNIKIIGYVGSVYFPASEGEKGRMEYEPPRGDGRVVVTSNRP